MAKKNCNERKIQAAEMKRLEAVKRRNRDDGIRNENIFKRRDGNKLCAKSISGPR
jgi:hypothetical protein